MKGNEYRVPVIGYLVVKTHDINGKIMIDALPMEFYCDDTSGIEVMERGLIREKDTILGVIPAVPKSFAIYQMSEKEDTSDQVVRYEIDGVTDPGYDRGDDNCNA